MPKSAGFSFGSALVKAIGIDPSNCKSLTFRIDNTGFVTAEVELFLTTEQVEELETELVGYEFEVLRRVEATNGEE